MKTASQIAQDCVSNQIGESQIEFEIQEYARSVAEHALKDASDGIDSSRCYDCGVHCSIEDHERDILNTPIVTP